MSVSDAGFRWFRRGVTLGLIVVCNLTLLGALWVSGLDLDGVPTGAALYDARTGPCLRVAWVDVSGVEGPLRVCSEWLDVTDPTGRVHTLNHDEPLAMSADGNLYYANARNAELLLLGLVIFAGAVIYLGMTAKRRLLTWYETRLRAHDPPADA